jgi:hypothetical protein
LLLLLFLFPFAFYLISPRAGIVGEQFDGAHLLVAQATEVNIPQLSVAVSIISALFDDRFRAAISEVPIRHPSQAPGKGKRSVNEGDRPLMESPRQTLSVASCQKRVTCRLRPRLLVALGDINISP